MNIYKKSFINLPPLAIVCFVLIFVLFPLFEPASAWGQNARTVIVRQQVTAEISLTVASSSMAMLPAIPGLTGGSGNASTSVSVITNNKEGYDVTIQASTTGRAGVLIGDTTAGVFTDYPATTAENWANSSGGQASRFGFGVTNTSLSTANGASGYGTCTTVEQCWSKVPTSSPKTIVTVTTFTPVAGDTFHVKFRAQIPANSNPLVPEDWYTATTTLTAVMK